MKVCHPQRPFLVLNSNQSFISLASKENTLVIGTSCGVSFLELSNAATWFGLSGGSGSAQTLYNAISTKRSDNACVGSSAVHVEGNRLYVVSEFHGVSAFNYDSRSLVGFLPLSTHYASMIFKNGFLYLTANSYNVSQEGLYIIDTNGMGLVQTLVNPSLGQYKRGLALTDSNLFYSGSGFVRILAEILGL